MNTATFMPELADRKLREQWEAEGSSTIHQRAMNKALEILSTPNSLAIDPDVDDRIRDEFDGLVAGNSTLPEGWCRYEVGGPNITRQRRTNKRRRSPA